MDIFEFAHWQQIKPSMSALECQCYSDWAVSWNLVGILPHMVLSWDDCWGCSCSTIVDAGAASSVLFVGSVLRVFGVAAVCQFQICVCVSGIVCLLSVSKFSLCQSASTVTKSLHSPVGASCQSVQKNAKGCVLIYWTATRFLQCNCTETTEILISQLLKGRVKQCRFSS